MLNHTAPLQKITQKQCRKGAKIFSNSTGGSAGTNFYLVEQIRLKHGDLIYVVNLFVFPLPSVALQNGGTQFTAIAM